MMDYDLDECASLREGGLNSPRIATGTMRSLISRALTWDRERFEAAHISTTGLRVFDAEQIEWIGVKERVEADPAAGTAA